MRTPAWARSALRARGLLIVAGLLLTSSAVTVSLAAPPAGSGFVATGSVVPTSGSGGQMIAGDVNQDGRPDVVELNTSENTVAVLLGDGQSGLAPAPGSPFAVHDSEPTGVATGDFTGDGKPDLAVGTTGSVPTGLSHVTLFAGDGTGRFTAAGPPLGVTYFDYAEPAPQAVAAGDINGDGKLDLVDSGDTPNPLFAVLLGNGSDGFTLAQPARSAQGQHVKQVSLTDVNGDGHLDIVALLACSANPDFATGGVAVLLGDGQGGFVPVAGSPFDTGALSPAQMAIGDVNGDHLADIAVGGSDVALLLGNGHGAFRLAGVPRWYGDPASVGIGHNPATGQPFVVVRPSFKDILQIFLSTPDGRLFSAPGSPFVIRSFPPSEGGYEATGGVAVADLNADGRPDVATDALVNQRRGSDNVAILTNNLPTVPTVNLTAGADPLRPGQTTTLVAHVHYPPVGGDVVLTDNGRLVGGTCGGLRGLKIYNGTATCRIGYRTPGVHRIVASYFPRPVTAASASGVLGVTVTSCRSLAGCRLSGANLQGANLTGAKLAHANLSGANLSGANLSWADLHNANLGGANMAGALFYHANLTNATMWVSSVAGASFYSAVLVNADLARSNITGANFLDANLTRADVFRVYGGDLARWGHTICTDGHPTTNFFCPVGQPDPGPLG